MVIQLENGLKLMKNMKITQSSNGRTRAFEVLNSGSTPLCVTKRVVTKVISTGALEASVSRFDSCLLD